MVFQVSIANTVAILNASKANANSSAIASDSEVLARIQFVQSITEEGRDASFLIADTVSDDSLTSEQKEEFVAQVIELAGGSDIGNGVLDVRSQRALRLSLERIGTGNVGYLDGIDSATVQATIQDVIKQGVAAGRLDADDIYNVVSPDVSAHTTGTRNLLSTIGDPALYDAVSTRLLVDARREGYDINNENGAFFLTEAADFANMAADLSQRGMFYSGAARAIVDEIARVDALGNATGDLSLIDAVLLSETVANNAIRERGAFSVFSEIINSVGYVSGARQVAADKLFSDLVRSSNGSAGGIDMTGVLSTGVDELGRYLTDNIGRLIELDWRNENTEGSSSGESFYNGLLGDGIENVILHNDFTLQDLFATAVAGEIVDLVAIAGDAESTDSEISEAGNTLGTLAGSINQAAENYVSQAADDSQSLRIFTDFLTDKIISIDTKKAGPAGIIASEGGKAFVNAIWQRIEEAAKDRANGDVGSALGDIKTMLADIRDVLGNSGDSRFVNRYDDREDQYHDRS